MTKLKIYLMAFVLGVVFIGSLMIVSAAGFEAEINQPLPPPTDTGGISPDMCLGGIVAPNGFACICPPGDFYIPGIGCNPEPCIQLGDGLIYCGTENTFTLTPAPTPVYPAPPPPPGGFGGFLQPITGTVFYTSLEYQITLQNGLDIRLANGEKVSIPQFVFSAESISSKSNLRIFSDDEAGIAVYLLTTGEFQINIGPDANGDVRVIIFDGLDAEYVYGYSFNVNKILNP